MGSHQDPAGLTPVPGSSAAAKLRRPRSIIARSLPLTDRGDPAACITAPGQLSELQHSVGNAAVAGLIQARGSRSTVSVQRDNRAPPPANASPAQEATRYLEAMGDQLDTLQQTATADLAGIPAGAAGIPRRQQILRGIGQERIGRFLRQASSTYTAQLGILPDDDAMRLPLRQALQRVLAGIRLVGSTSLRVSDGIPTADRQTEVSNYAQNQAAWIEASPMTSAGLAGQTTFAAGDTAAATAYVRQLDGYLDDLLANFAGLQITPADRDAIARRIDIALRRAFVSVETGPDGLVALRSITDPQIADKYRRVVALLQTGMTARAPITIITDSLPAYPLPNPIPAPNLAGTPVPTMDVSHVPDKEVASVRFGIDRAARTVWPPGSANTFRNAVWPVSIPVRVGATVTSVRYEFVFDATGNARAERLGGPEGRGVDPVFAALPVDQKKAQLTRTFGLRAIDDRPASGARAAGVWSPSDLDQLKSAFDRLPPAGRGNLAGVTLVRDIAGPPMGGGRTEQGFAHTGPDPQHDQPGPPAHPPPHIHYNNQAFAANAFSTVGAPGDAGPAVHWTMLHEVGHFQVFAATMAGNAAVAAANTRLNQSIAAVNAANPTVTWNGHPAWVAARNTWNQARLASNQAAVHHNQAVLSPNAAIKAQAAARLVAARAASVLLNQRVAAMRTAGIPVNFVNAAASVGAAIDAMVAGSEQMASAAAQIPTFSRLAQRFGFVPFTSYGATAPDEFFAESYALFVNDPNRLSALNRQIFQWFAAGMPMDPTWNP